MFKKGDKVRCVSVNVAVENYLTEGSEYTLTEGEFPDSTGRENLVSLIDDTGTEGTFYAYRFEKVVE